MQDLQSVWSVRESTGKHDHYKLVWEMNADLFPHCIFTLWLPKTRSVYHGCTICLVANNIWNPTWQPKALNTLTCMSLFEFRGLFTFSRGYHLWVGVWAHTSSTIVILIAGFLAQEWQAFFMKDICIRDCDALYPQINKCCLAFVCYHS